MSQKPNDPKTKIGDLPENKEGLSPEELENVAGGLLRSPAAGAGGRIGTKGGLNETTQATLDTNGMPDTTSSSADS